MNYPGDIEEKIGFSRIREILESACNTEEGRRIAARIGFLSDYARLKELLAELQEHLNLFRESPGLFDLYQVPDAADTVAFLMVEDAVPSESMLHELRILAQVFRNISNWLSKHAERFPIAAARFDRQQNPPDPIIRPIDRVLDADGKMRPDASPELQRISAEIARKEKESRNLVSRAFKSARENGFAADTEITIRNSRLVIPLVADKRHKVQGIVHDESSTGKILYLEPMECFSLNNELRELELERRREIERILREIGKVLYPHLPSANHFRTQLARFDFLAAKCRLADKIRGTVPAVHPEPGLRLMNARHPVLHLSLEKEGKSVVPVSLGLEQEHRIMVISGPNAGGKSVTLKTAAVLQYMAQCALPVSADESSSFGTFSRIMADMGDNQSLEDHLSSYSSHLLNMKYFITHGDRKSLFVIDEMGTGTDPQLGGAMSEAILEKLVESGCMGIVTTHYGNLKEFASATRGVSSASMAFDPVALKPLYRLIEGKAGSSFTFEVAASAGLPAELVKAARRKVKGGLADADSLLTETATLKQKLDQSEKRIAEKEQLLDKLTSEYSILKSNLEQRRSEILNRSRSEALEIVREANKQVEKTIRTIVETKASGKVAKELRDNLRKTAEHLQSELKETAGKTRNHKPEIPKDKSLPYTVTEDQNISVGDDVLHTANQATGKVISVKKNKAEVMFGDVRMLTELGSLKKIRIKGGNARQKSAVFINESMVEKQIRFKPELDLRGERGEDAVQKLISFLDEAWMLGQFELKVIHGRGDGILRKQVRELLKQNNRVKSYRQETEQFGGDGVTLITLY